MAEIILPVDDEFAQRFNSFSESEKKKYGFLFKLFMEFDTNPLEELEYLTQKMSSEEKKMD